MATSWLRRVLIVLSAVPVLGTLLSFSRRTHWIFRVWDFPRVQIAAAAAAGGALFARLAFRRRPLDIGILAASALVVGYQLRRIYTYTPFVRPTVRRATGEDRENTITLLISNVLMENREYGKVLDAVRQNDPDVFLVVENDATWQAALEPLTSELPHVVRQPLDNYYGMSLFSRFELVDPRVEYLVQDDIPSIRTGIRLPGGVVITLRGLHPRPPEPIRDEPSSPRDAELVLVGREIGEHKGETPTIVAGDLNDVAWSASSELFVRLSGLLDPRVGRGFFNSFNAKNPLLRYPLDHVFHSIHFELVHIERLPAVGSDHFPILITLRYDPSAAGRQEESHRKSGDERDADLKLEQEAHDAATGYDRPRGE